MHVSVFKHELVEALNVMPGRLYVDGTFGRGGHTAEVLEQGGRVIAFDVDTDAIAFGRMQFFNQIDDASLTLIESNYSKLGEKLEQAGVKPGEVAGMMFDLGMSSNQIEESGRGFTFMKDEPLDMRMSQDLGVTAADLVNALPEKHLKNLIWENSQEIAAGAIARAIVKQREKKPFRTTKELADLILKVKHGRQDSHLNPATKTFQALRIAVNLEMESIQEMLDSVLVWLAPQGRLAIISFHEGEDRLIKNAFKTWEAQGQFRSLSKKPISPSNEELKKNPRSRSAKLRIGEKV